MITRTWEMYRTAKGMRAQLRHIRQILTSAPCRAAKRRCIVSMLALGLTTVGFSAAADAAVLFSDGFDGSSLDGTNWHLPAWTPDGATFFGRTQLRVSQTVPLPLPQVANGVVRLALSSYNPTAISPGDSFYGSEVVSNPTFAIGDGVVIEVTARLVSPIPGGIVGGIFAYNAPSSPGGSHDEVDFELVSNLLSQLQTQVYANEPLGAGHPVFYELPNAGSITEFHTYKMEIMPDSVSWYVDGQLLRTDTAHVPKGAMQFYLNVWAPDAGWAEAYNAALQPSATASGNQDYFMEVDSVLISTAGSPSADLSIDMGDSPDPAMVGSPLTYAITVTNNGPDPATSVTISDTLVAGLTFVSATPSRGSCSGTSSIVCSLGALNSGGSATMTVIVTPTQAGGISNTATVTGNETDPNLTNNSATQVTTVSPAPLLSAVSPAELWIGQNGSNRTLKFDLLTEVLVNGSTVSSGQLANVKGGGSGFNKATLDTVALVLGAATAAPSGSSLSMRVSVRVSCSIAGKRSAAAGIARLWYNGQPIDSGRRKVDAGSRFDATIGGTNNNYFLRPGLALATTPGSARQFTDVAVDNSVACPARPFVSLGTWSMTLP